MNFTTCPKCHHTRRPDDQAPPGTCPACGLVFRKWLKYQNPVVTVRGGQFVPSRWRFLWEAVSRCPASDPWSWSGRLLVWAALCVWGGHFFLLGPGRAEAVYGSFLHGVNLVFHEAGHVIFMPFGDFLHVLGGSLGQVLMPGIVLLTFLLKNRDPFGAAVALWWVGQSAMDVAIYIDDARALALPLLGGGTGYDDPGRHDWHYLLARLGWLQRDHALAAAVYGLGRLFMLAAWLWGGQVLYRQFRRGWESGAGR
jgi:hypothetical protein